MAIAMLGPLNKIINETTTELLNKQVNSAIADVLTTLVKTTFGVADDLLKRVQELTQDAQP
jgi:Holliday junction resolvasome RuvABC ATP-dependent DNA helicase subunit